MGRGATVLVTEQPNRTGCLAFGRWDPRQTKAGVDAADPRRKHTKLKREKLNVPETGGTSFGWFTSVEV